MGSVHLTQNSIPMKLFMIMMIEKMGKLRMIVRKKNKHNCHRGNHGPLNGQDRTKIIKLQKDGRKSDHSVNPLIALIFSPDFHPIIAMNMIQFSCN